MKPKVAVFDFASCEGCELQIANLEEEVIELSQLVDIVSFREVMKEHSDDYDIAFIEGSISRPIDVERLKNIRSKAKILIALGDCACTGCVNKLRNEWSVSEVKKEVYPDANSQMKNNEFFDVFPAKAVDEIVDVDFYIRGCPIRKDQFLYYVKRFLEMPPKKAIDIRFDVSSRDMQVDPRSIIQFDAQKCILCRHCHVICNDVLDVHAIGISEKGNESIISTPFDKGLDDNKCIRCGQCLVNCPVGAFSEHSSIDEIKTLCENPKNYVIVVIDPIAMASAVESLNTSEKTLRPVIKKTISAFQKLGAKKVLDFTNFMYLSIAAQGKFVREHKDMSFTSWCPSASIYVKNFYPEYKHLLHPEFEPVSLMTNILKKRYKNKNLKIILLSPCIVYKQYKNLDAVLTARELPKLLKSSEIDLDFLAAEDVEFDTEYDMPITFLRGARNDNSYSLPILEAAYMGKFNNLDSALEIKTIDDYAHSIAFDSEEGFFNALVIEDIAKVKKYMKSEIRKYNLVEFFPCLDGCLSGGGQELCTKPEILEQRKKLLKEYKGLIKGHSSFISNIIQVYEKARGDD